VFVVSDFISPPGWEKTLGQLAERHEVTAVRLFDPLEMNLPDLGLILMRDAETGEQLVVDTHDAGFRRRFSARRQSARRPCEKGLPPPASTPSSSPPTTTSRARSCALPISASNAAASPTGVARREAFPTTFHSPPRWHGHEAHVLGGRADRIRPRLGCGGIAGAPGRAETAAMTIAPLVHFLWPTMLYALLAIPLLLFLYIWLLRKRKKTSIRYASLSLVKEAMAGRSAWRRHVPPALLLMALTALLLAAARPAAMLTLPSHSQTIMLAMDVSGSMRATDVQPNRLVASQEAAKAFVAELPRNVQIGVVAFAGTAAVVQAPTLSRDDVNAAIDRFQLQRATAIGSGIVLSLATIFPEAGIDLSQITGQRNMPPAPGDKPKPPFTPVPPGSYASAAIILLTDGQRTTGPDPVEAAKMAADRGVRIYTVGIGTKDGETIAFEGWSMRVRLDEETLKTIATITRADYFYAGTAADLKKVYQGLSTRLVLEKRETEISGLLAALGALLVVTSAGLSVWWFGRVA
jgi:Ca-activated chloride channel family protein